MVVENDNEDYFCIVSWVFLIYLMVMSFFVVLIVVVGLELLFEGLNFDFFVLMILFVIGNEVLVMLFFIGGFFLVFFMVIVVVIVVLIMVFNYIVFLIWFWVNCME